MFAIVLLEPAFLEHVRIIRSPDIGSGSGSAANAGSQSFTQGGGYPGFGGFSGSGSAANAGSSSFNQGGFPGLGAFGGSGSSANAGSQSFTQGGGFPGFGGSMSGSSADASSQSLNQVNFSIIIFLLICTCINFLFTNRAVFQASLDLAVVLGQVAQLLMLVVNLIIKVDLVVA